MNRAVDALRLQLQQLQAQHDRGELGSDALAEARAPLERELVDLVLQDEEPDGAAAAVVPPRPSKRLQGALWSLVLVLAVTGYWLTGSPDFAGHASIAPAGTAPPVATAGTNDFSEAQVQEMVQRLADRLKEKPDDAAGWTILARAYSAMGRYSDAVPAFQKALALSGENADLLADFADTLAAQNGGKLVGEPMRLVQRALTLDASNLKALALSGSAAFDERDYASAVRQWEQVERSLPADSSMLAQVRASIAQARSLGRLPGPGQTPAVSQ